MNRENFRELIESIAKNQDFDWLIEWQSEAVLEALDSYPSADLLQREQVYSATDATWNLRGSLSSLALNTKSLLNSLEADPKAKSQAQALKPWAFSFLDKEERFGAIWDFEGPRGFLLTIPPAKTTNLGLMAGLIGAALIGSYLKK